MKRILVLLLLLSSVAFSAERKIHNNTVRIDDSGIIFSDSVGINGALTAPDTVTTASAGTWYPVGGSFINPFSNHFSISGDTITVYCNAGRVQVLAGVTLESTVNGTTISVAISRNGAAPTIGITKSMYLKNNDEFYSITLVGFGYLELGDEIVFVISSDKAGADIIITSFTYSISRTFR